MCLRACIWFVLRVLATAIGSLSEPPPVAKFRRIMSHHQAAAARGQVPPGGKLAHFAASDECETEALMVREPGSVDGSHATLAACLSGSSGEYVLDGTV